MTTIEPPRRPRRSLGRGQVVSTRTVRSEVGETLREAREHRGVDLHRVERDTKIRLKFLAALEDGEFTELPGDVYARGFLRNYATYLGLDADQMEEEWRSEAGAAMPLRPTFAGPQPMRLSRRVVFQRSHIAIAVVAVIVLLVASYFGFQLTRYLSYPTLAVASAGAQDITLPIGTTTYVLTGNATPGTTVQISWNGQDAKTVIVDDSGTWSFQAVLQPGRNQFDIRAINLDTNHPSDTTRLIIIVATPTPTPIVPSVALLSPTDASVFKDGSVTVTGTANLVSKVTLTPILVGGPLPAGATLPPATPTPAVASATPAAPSASASTLPAPASSATTAPLSAVVGADGTFTFTLKLRPGRWQLAVVGTATKDGAPTKAASRTVSVPYTGIYVEIVVKNGDASLYVQHDGQADVPVNSSEPVGWTHVTTASKYMCISANPPGNVYISVNGSSYVSVSSLGGWHAAIGTTLVPTDAPQGC
ncbi:MAG TPA: helix-turn-helix transcriptional regulator [Candidatus Limnocylindrales bacterium]